MRVGIISGAVMAVVLMARCASAETTWVGPNGGQMVDAGGFHVELLVRNSEYRVNVYDHVDKPVAVAQATAVVTVIAGDDREKVTMQPIAANTLAGSGSMTRTAGTKILVLLRVPDQATAMARFELP